MSTLDTHPGRLLIERAVTEQRAQLLSDEERELFLAFADYVYDNDVGESWFKSWLREQLDKIRGTRLSTQIIDALLLYGRACRSEQRATKRAKRQYGNP